MTIKSARIKILKITLICLLLSFVGVGCLYYAFTNGYLRLNYPSYTEFPVRGIDVSNHQSDIDWQNLDSTDVQFAFIKATEGADFKDKRYRKNWQEADKKGIVRSAYHFFTFCRSGSEQAFNFIETVPNEPNMLPPAIDLEYGGNCKLTKTKEELLFDIDNFIEIIEAEYNRKVIIYVTEEFYNDFLIDRYRDNPLWVRDIRKRARVKDGRDWTFWQFASKGRLKGINTLVDLNVFKGNMYDFTRFLNKKIN